MGLSSPRELPDLRGYGSELRLCTGMASRTGVLSPAKIEVIKQLEQLGGRTKNQQWPECSERLRIPPPPNINTQYYTSARPLFSFLHLHGIPYRIIPSHCRPWVIHFQSLHLLLYVPPARPLKDCFIWWTMSDNFPSDLRDGYCFLWDMYNQYLEAHRPGWIKVSWYSTPKLLNWGKTPVELSKACRNDASLNRILPKLPYSGTKTCRDVNARKCSQSRCLKQEMG
jgi:hypothetical protein